MAYHKMPITKNSQSPCTFRKSSLLKQITVSVVISCILVVLISSGLFVVAYRQFFQKDAYEQTTILKRAENRHDYAELYYVQDMNGDQLAVREF